jgi:hypothetical protein
MNPWSWLHSFGISHSLVVHGVNESLLNGFHGFFLIRPRPGKQFRDPKEKQEESVDEILLLLTQRHSKARAVSCPIFDG